MEYVKPSMRVSRMDISTRLLAGSGLDDSNSSNYRSFSIKSGQSANTQTQVAGGGYMMARERGMMFE